VLHALRMAAGGWDGGGLAAVIIHQTRPCMPAQAAQTFVCQ
jgi:hypothetical protein